MDYINISVETTVNKPIAQVWEKFTTPTDIMNWNHASDDWYTPTATNDLRAGGSFSYKMAARDGSMNFVFGGIFEEVIIGEKLAYTLEDGRNVVVEFTESDGCVSIRETFEVENTNSLERQREGWQAILDNFKKYTEKC